LFESITNRLQSVLSRLSRGGRLTPENVQDGLREIRQALLEADVNFKVAKDLIQKVTERASGQEIIESVQPGQQIVKIFHDELTALMGGADGGGPLPLSHSGPTVIMLCGLQGSGKTTTAGKLANWIRRKGRHPMLVAADLQRPAAIDQLVVLGEKLGVPVHRGVGRTPPEVCLDGVAAAKAAGRDVVILDTAGRLHIDAPLMSELSEVKARVKPHQILLVVDAMTGQDAVTSAKAFHDQLGLDGVILTKLDGDTRGGAAISIKAVTGAPIRFLGVGEKLDNLEEFHADRLASRILGMGDVVSLVERAKEVIEEKEAEQQVVKLLQDEFTFEDFLFQLRAMKKLGPLKDVLGMMPGGLGAQLKDAPIDDKALDHVEAMICSMTREERLRPKIIDGQRRRRIARGAGRGVDHVNQLLKQYDGMRQMMKQMRSGGMLGKMAARMMPGGGSALKEHKAAQVEALRQRGKLDKQRRKDQKQARKANRKRR
jgi:signal recognition particle subunit SRP54